MSVNNIYLYKCFFSKQPNNTCEFAREFNVQTHCMLMIEWWEDTNVKHLEKCMIGLREREKLAWRNRMLKKNPVGKI